MDRQFFQNPPSNFRAAPFWSWNDDLDDSELVRQVNEIAKAGWGGFFMHSRVGLITPYLTDKWMKRVQTCVDEAKRLGMCAYLYDEDKWPSGFAGGLVPAIGSEHRAKALCCKVDNKPTHMREALCRFVARWEGPRLRDLTRVDDLFDAPHAEVFITLYPSVAQLGNDWFQGYTYVDLLNPETVDAFLASTHARYYDVVGDDFGEAIPAIFTDEPCYLFSALFAGHRGRAQNVVPWTDGLEEYFKEKRGYDLLEVLPSVFFDVGDYRKVRYDYWLTVTERFVSSFTRRVYEWCEKHGIALTGHFMAEDTLAGQISWIGAAMPHYEFMQYPGIDKLSRHTEQVATCKQLNSAVEQLGKERALCEAYGCCGQDFSFRGRKWIGDWLYVLGVNLLNPHLSLYSMRGERKRDYPANLYYQQPWWPYNKEAADYFGRLSYALTRGQQEVDVLVIHPIGSAWTMYRPDGSQELAEYDAMFADLCRSLLAWHHDYHFGDEMIMAQHASVSGSRLKIGRQSYGTVVVPPGITLSSHTSRLLHQLADGGGTVIAVAPCPTAVDGVETDSVLPQKTRVVGNLEELREALDELANSPVNLAGANSVWYHYRVDGDQRIVFLTNTSDEVGTTTTAAIRGRGRVQEWDLLTGEIKDLPSELADDHVVLTLQFDPSGSHLVVIDGGQSPRQVPQQDYRPIAEYDLQPQWQLAVLDDNALTLDTVWLRLGESDWQGPLYVLDAAERIVGAGLGTTFAVKYSFHVTDLPSDHIYLILETPERFEILVNGIPVSPETSEHWLDISFRKLDVTASIKPGRNTVTLRGQCHSDTEIESCYIVGHFSVSSEWSGESKSLNGQSFRSYAPRFAIDGCVPTLGGTNLVEEGLPFYAGGVTLRQTIRLPEAADRIVLSLEGVAASVASVSVNEHHVRDLLWPPYDVDLTRFIEPGANTIQVTLFNTLRNLLGPHHQRGGDACSVGPGDFRDKLRWTDDYWLVPFGVRRAKIIMFEKE